MRLLNVKTLEFREFSRERDVPPYITASHRWKAGEEAMIGDFQSKSKSKKHTSGYRKVEGFAAYICQRFQEVEWLWIDTCCVDQKNLVEIDEAVNSMFRWYKNSVACIAYLADVSDPRDEDELKSSEWFRRSWTLQELLAPHLVVFLSVAWETIGHKGMNDLGLTTGPSLEREIAAITRIPESVLHDYTKSEHLTSEEKLAWISDRDATKIEDIYYSLLGIFGVRMRLSYGEGVESAKQRLLKKINSAPEEAVNFNEIIKWLSPSDPWSNHETARQQREQNTGEWMLRSREYLAWKSGLNKALWIHGKAGCGKTVLCSTLIDDIRRHCDETPNSGYAIFYFSFSDKRKQTSENLLFSLAAQLGNKDPALSALSRAYNSPHRSLPSSNDLLEVILSAIHTYNECFLVFDALDECPEDGEVRQRVLKQLENIWQGTATKCKILVTSRNVGDIWDCMRALKAGLLLVNSSNVDADIQKYVSTQLAQDWRLRKLDASVKGMIEEHVSGNADGMFRWAYCQLQELKKLKSTKPSHITQALRNLPRNLDETYERMLTAIDESLRNDAVMLLQWLAYKKSPPTLEELVEACIIDPSGEGRVDLQDRGSLGDSLEILSGLVIIVAPNSDNSTGDGVNFQWVDGMAHSTNYWASLDSTMKHTNEHSSQSKDSETRIRLAHFSVKEFLESDRILYTAAKDFRLESGTAHRFLAQSCLTYLLFYNKNRKIQPDMLDVGPLPLLTYAASFWYYHSFLQEPRAGGHEVSLLSSKTARYDWLSHHERSYNMFHHKNSKEESESGLFYASYLGLEAVVKELLSNQNEANAAVDNCDIAPATTSLKWRQHFAETLPKKNPVSKHRGSPLSPFYDASALNRERAEENELLMRNRWTRSSLSPLYGASLSGHGQIVQILLEKGANVNAMVDDPYATPLIAASYGGHEHVVQLLLANGADVNVKGGIYGYPLNAAAWGNNDRVVQMLCENGADVNLLGIDGYDRVLEIARRHGFEQDLRLKKYRPNRLSAMNVRAL